VEKVSFVLVLPVFSVAPSKFSEGASILAMNDSFHILPNSLLSIHCFSALDSELLKTNKKFYYLESGVIEINEVDVNFYSTCR
jgi:hypothetical protein